MPGSREEDFWRNTSILPQHYLPFGWGVMKFTISGLLPLMMLHTKFCNDWPSSFWGEDVNARPTTDDARRRTPTHSNRSPEWLRWPKNQLYKKWFVIDFLSWGHVKIAIFNASWGHWRCYFSFTDNLKLELMLMNNAAPDWFFNFQE